MPVRVLRPGEPAEPGEAVSGRPSREGAPAQPLRCALVNNMPDSALVQTEGQFLGLLEAGAGDRDVTVRRYGLAGVPRGERTAEYIASEYFPAEGLWADEPHALLVTGSEPLSASRAAEPYWDAFVGLLHQALARPTSVLLSCLAAHAALLALDGIDRVALPAKRFGVFGHDVRPGAALTAGMAPSVPMPHSRLNEIPTDALAAAGWDVLISAPTGWGAVAARRDHADLLLVQGHPEYGPVTLVREWRRDLGRWQRGERRDIPEPPVTAVLPEDQAAMVDLHRRLSAGDDAEAALGAFGWDTVGARAPATWRPAAETLYANWIGAMMPSVPVQGRVQSAGH